MKYYFYLASIAFVLTACKNNPQTVVAGPGIDLTGYELTKIKGTDRSYAKSLDQDGNLIGEGMLVGGVQDGTWITYHSEKVNKFKTVANFVMGVMNGPYMEFNDRGQIEKKSTFLNNQIDGLYSEYKFGRPVKEYMYKNGVLDGISKEYSSRGDLSKETAYKDGKLHGTIKQFDEEGAVILEYEYKNGEKISGGIVTK